MLSNNVIRSCHVTCRIMSLIDIKNCHVTYANKKMLCHVDKNPYRTHNYMSCLVMSFTKITIVCRTFSMKFIMLVKKWNNGSVASLLLRSQRSFSAFPIRLLCFLAWLTKVISAPSLLWRGIFIRSLHIAEYIHLEFCHCHQLENQHITFQETMGNNKRLPTSNESHLTVS